MSNLVVFDFDGIHTTDEVLNKLRSLEKEYLIDLEDACVVVRDKSGKVHRESRGVLARRRPVENFSRCPRTVNARESAGGRRSPWARSRVAPSRANCARRLTNKGFDDAL
jgi:hypothetical protein